MFSSLFCLDNSENSFSICISNNGTVYSFGCCNTGAHGQINYQIDIPTEINNLSYIKLIDCSYNHTLCLNYEGIVYSFGSNEKGQLGIGKSKIELPQTYIPQKINIPPCKQVSCGTEFSICLTEDDKIYSFGNNESGQLGLGNNENYNSPQLISYINDIEFITCSSNFVLCKLYNNTCYCWGLNTSGQLGIEIYQNTNIPVLCVNWPDNIISIKCGIEHSLLLTSEGQVFSCGSNTSGALGLHFIYGSINYPVLNKDLPKIQRIECGPKHSMCIDINNNFWVFGQNSSNELGLGDNIGRYKPIIHPKLINIIDISSGGSHTFVKTIDNKIYAFGYNEYSQLGIKTSENKQLIPIQVFIDNEDIWCSTIGKSKQKSARK